MKLKEWAFMGNYDFYTNKLQVLAANELPPEKWKRILPKFDRRFNCVCEKKN